MRARLLWPTLFGLAVGIQRLSRLAPDWVEGLYSRHLFPAVARGLSFIFGLFPFSVAELTVWVTVPLIILWLIVAARAVGRRPRAKRLEAVWRHVALVLVVFVIAYAGFVFLWGVNYNRQPLAQTIGLKTGQASVDELAALCRLLIDRANALRPLVGEDSTGVAVPNGGVDGALRRAQQGFDRAAANYPALGGRYSRPKGVLTSALWSYTGTSGMYWPFTGEANVNTAAPAFTIPATAAHEMAHQRGFAREDEANYLAYLTCRFHPDADFQYSGTMLALTEAMSALRGRDPGTFKELAGRYGAGVKRDLVREAEFWKTHEGLVSDYSDRVNDRYLKANGQTEGIGSYGRMVDLLLAEFRANSGR